jgi:hypothetical protein
VLRGLGGVMKSSFNQNCEGFTIGKVWHHA